MLFLLKNNIKTTFLLLLFITVGTYLLADNSQLHKIGIGSQFSLENTGLQEDYKGIDVNYLSSKDTVILSPSETVKTQSNQNEKFSIPPELEKIPINFTINSTISYYSFKHFVNDESKKLFFQAWLKEIELQKLSAETDSLRKTYSIAPIEQREGGSPDYYWIFF